MDYKIHYLKNTLNNYINIMKFYAHFKYKLPNTINNGTTEILRLEANDIQEAEYKIKDIVYKQNGYDLRIIELYII